MAQIYRICSGDVEFSHSLDAEPRQSDFQMHVHSKNEIYVFVRGEASYLVEGNEYRLRPGSMLLIREAESHAINFLSSAPYERYVLNFPTSSLEAIDPEGKLLAPFFERELGVGNHYEPQELPHISALSAMRRMELADADEYSRSLAVSAGLPALLLDIRSAFLGKEKSEAILNSEAGKIVSYINSHLFEELNVHLLSGVFYISESQIERIMRKHTHSSLWQYITRKRLAAARVRIASGTGAAVAAEECGFGDYSSFYRAYVKEYGMPPNAHKRKG